MQKGVRSKAGRALLKEAAIKELTIALVSVRKAHKHLGSKMPIEVGRVVGEIERLKKEVEDAS